MPVTTLPSAWRYRASAGTGRPGVSNVRLAEKVSVICKLLSMASQKTEQTRP